MHCCANHNKSQISKLVAHIDCCIHILALWQTRENHLTTLRLYDSTTVRLYDCTTDSTTEQRAAIVRVRFADRHISHCSFLSINTTQYSMWGGIVAPQCEQATNEQHCDIVNNIYW